jgi:hypothetical protein
MTLACGEKQRGAAQPNNNEVEQRQLGLTGLHT